MPFAVKDERNDYGKNIWADAKYGYYERVAGQIELLVAVGRRRVLSPLEQEEEQEHEEEQEEASAAAEGK